MKFLWIDDVTIHRCDFQHPVAVPAIAFGGLPYTDTVKHAGFVVQRNGYWMASVYGSVNPDSFSQEFDNIDEAKAYVEQQALVGIAINKLTR